MPTICFRTDGGDTRLRLDQILLRHVRGVSRLSRTQVQRWIDAGIVTVDGRSTRRASAHLREGAEVTVTLPDGTRLRSRPAAENLTLDVVYEDAHLMALNKPPGIVVHPTYKQHAGTLLNAVLWRLRDRPDAQPGILTRLDKDTSGLVIVALDAATHAAMQRGAARGEVRKEYLAMVRGVPRPRHGRIVAPLARDPLDRRRVVVTADGAVSETRYEVLDARKEDTGARHEWISLVRCELVTGRTHQIRVHLASRGWPVLGDRMYGVPHLQLTRQALHAWRITLPHPVSRERLTLTAPLPDDMSGCGLPTSRITAP